MCREAQDAKEHKDGPLSGEDPFNCQSTLRSLEELKQDFIQRAWIQEVEVSAEVSVRKWAEEAPLKVQLQKFSRAERRSKGVMSPKSALPSLEELEREFQNRRAVRQQGTTLVSAAPTPVQKAAFAPEALQAGTLKKLVEGKGFGFILPDGGSKDVFLHFSDLVNGTSEDMVVGMRVSYQGEMDAKSGKTRARNASIIRVAPKATAPEVHPCSEEPNAVPVYARRELLAVLQSLVQADKASDECSFPIRTVHMPHCEVYSQRRGRYAKDPRLDDEDLLVEMEDRLSRESGADAKNVETFGECFGGWSFEEAVEANARLPHRTFARPGTGFDFGLDPLLPFGVIEERRLETPPLVMHAVRRSMYRAVALHLCREPKDQERSLSPVPSSGSLERCPSTSTAASSGSTSPSGHPSRLCKDLWGNATPCYQ